MRQRMIGDGRVTLTVSEICLGTMYFGYRTDEATSFAILDRFAEAGGTFLDTANCYGQWHGNAWESERVIGRWLSSRGMAGRMVIATKVGARTTVPVIPTRGTGRAWGPPRSARTPRPACANPASTKKKLTCFTPDEPGRPPWTRRCSRGPRSPSAARRDCSARATPPFGASSAPGRSPAPMNVLATPAAAAHPTCEACSQDSWTRSRNSSTTPRRGPALLAHSPARRVYARLDRPLPAAYAHAGRNPERLAVLGEVPANLGATPGQVVLAWLARVAAAGHPDPRATGRCSNSTRRELAATELTLDPRDDQTLPTW